MPIGRPDGLRQIAADDPVSLLAAATRDLFGNPTTLPASAARPLDHPVASSLAWCVALLAPLPRQDHRLTTVTAGLGLGGGEQCVGHLSRRRVERTGTAGEHDAPSLLRLATHSDDLDAVR